MDRRELLKMIAVLTGGTVIGAQPFLAGCTDNKIKGDNKTFSQEDIAYLDEIAETILPATKTPGAKAAKVGQFMTVMVTDCYEPKDQEVFHEGMDKLNKASEKKFDKPFMNISAQQRHVLLVEIDKESKEHQKKKSDSDRERNERKKKEETKRSENQIKGADSAKEESEKYIPEKPKDPEETIEPDMRAHYFTMMKQLTLLGYFTSEIGATQALRYDPVPGRYEGCVPYKKGDRAWA